ncbi:hypothetical protein NWQ33_03185 [Mycoplasmopsis cynos]|nr:hypothetical protein [Mycoplasmopsis cynos]
MINSENKNEKQIRNRRTYGQKLGAFIDFLKQITKSNQNGNKGSEFENFIRNILDTWF